MKMKYNFSEIIYYSYVLRYWKWFTEINDSTPLIYILTYVQYEYIHWTYIWYSYRIDKIYNKNFEVSCLNATKRVLKTLSRKISGCVTLTRFLGIVSVFVRKTTTSVPAITVFPSIDLENDLVYHRFLHFISYLGYPLIQDYHKRMLGKIHHKLWRPQN